jgi:hypothetical protein
VIGMTLALTGIHRDLGFDLSFFGLVLQVPVWLSELFFPPPDWRNPPQLTEELEYRKTLLQWAERQQRIERVFFTAIGALFSVGTLALLVVIAMGWKELATVSEKLSAFLIVGCVVGLAAMGFWGRSTRTMFPPVWMEQLRKELKVQ